MQKRKIRWLVLVLCFCFICTVPANAGAIKNNMDALQNALNQADQSIGTYEKEKNALEQNIAKGQESIRQLAEQLDNTEKVYQNTKDEIAKTQKELKIAEQDKQEQYEDMKLRIRFMYEHSTESMLVDILRAGSLSEMLKRANYFEAVAGYDRQKLEEFKAVARKIKKQKEELESNEQELLALKQKQTEELSEMDAMVQQFKGQLSEALSKIQSSKELRKKYEQEIEKQKEYERQLELKKAEEAKKRQEEIRRQEEEFKKQQEAQRKREEASRQTENSGGTGSGTQNNDTGSDTQNHDTGSDTRNNDTGSSASGDTDSSGSNSGANSGIQDNGNTGADTASAGDLELLSTIIYCEAGNQPYEGQLAVGSVVMNRVASSSFPNSVSGVIYQSGQFSPVTSGRFAYALGAGLGSSCRSAAQAVLSGTRTVNCLYFMVNTGTIDGIVIGDHVFY